MSLLIRREGETLIAEGWEDRERFALDYLFEAIRGASAAGVPSGVTVTFKVSNVMLVYELDTIDVLNRWVEGQLVSAQ